jgi:tRNA(Ser,Leu) C12 N-acetylase TAN1
MDERTFFVLVGSGEEKDASARMRHDLPGTKVVKRAKGKVVFRFEGDALELEKLCWAAGVFISVAHFNDVGRRRGAADALARQASEADLEAALDVWARVSGKPAPESFSVQVTRAGLHDFSTFDVERAARGHIARRRGWRPVGERADLLIRLEVYSEEAFLSFKLPLKSSGESLARRSRRACFAEAASAAKAERATARTQPTQSPGGAMATARLKNEGGMKNKRIKEA